MPTSPVTDSVVLSGDGARRVCTWQTVQSIIMRRIQDRTYRPGGLIPTEQQLAVELSCARATVNRALTELARRGIVERRRKVGTRVAEAMCTASAVKLPLLREVIEDSGAVFSHRLISFRRAVPPRPIRQRLLLRSGAEAVHTVDLLIADDRPWGLEQRWSHAEVFADVSAEDFDALSINEWITRNVPFQRSEIEVIATTARDAQAADHLGTLPGEALLSEESCSWVGTTPRTTVRLTYAPGYRLRATV